MAGFRENMPGFNSQAAMWGNSNHEKLKVGHEAISEVVKKYWNTQWDNCGWEFLIFSKY